MCGIAGIIYRNGASSVGSDMTRMLQSMKHRGPDSTGYALYGPAGTRRARALQAGRLQQPARLRLPRPARPPPERGAVAHGVARREGALERRRDRVRLPRDARVHGRPQAARRLRRGRARRRGALDRPLARDRQGSRRRRAGRRAVRARTTSRARTPSATCAWRPSPTSTSRARTPTGRTRSRTSRSCTTAS